MNDTDHTFTIPETEQHKLDDLKEDIIHPIARRLHRHLRRSPWPAVALATVTGLLFGLMLQRRGR